MAATYRTAMGRYAGLGELDVWYEQVRLDRFVDFFVAEERGEIAHDIEHEARKRTSRRAAKKLVRVVDGDARIVDNPPFRIRIEDAKERAEDQTIVESYRATLPEHVAHLLERFTVVDVARQVVGVGSVGMRVFLVLFEGRSGDDPLFLQFKEAGPSVYEAHLGPSAHANHGQRVTVGRQLIQSAGDIFTGWTHVEGRDVYVRQYRDMKVIPDPESIGPRLASSPPRAAPCWPGPTPAPATPSPSPPTSGSRHQVRPGRRPVRRGLRRPERARPRPAGRRHRRRAGRDCSGLVSTR